MCDRFRGPEADLSPVYQNCSWSSRYASRAPGRGTVPQESRTVGVVPTTVRAEAAGVHQRTFTRSPFHPGRLAFSRSCVKVFQISSPPVKASEDRGVRGSAIPTLPGSFSRMQTSLRTVRRVDTTARAQALNVPARSRGQPVPSPTMRQGYLLQMLSAVVPRTTDSRPRSFGRARDRRSDPAVPLVLRRIAVAKANAYR